MSVAHVARRLLVCLLAANVARAEVPAEASPAAGEPRPAQAKPRPPPPTVLIIPLIGPVLMPVTLPTALSKRRGAARAGVQTSGTAAPAPAATEGSAP
jgi:hypothetical protein